MNFSRPFILRPVMTTLLMVAVIVLGIASFRSLPVSNLPDVNYPTITVTVPFPGTNPEIMANTVATPLEKQFMTIPGIRYVTSSNSLGVSSIILEFEIDKNIDLVAVDVETAIAAARAQLPPNLPQEPTYRKVNPSSTPVVYIAVTSPTLTQGELYDYANTVIGQRISILSGVAQVQVYGSPYAVRVQVDPGVVASLGIGLEEISNALLEGNQYQPLGQFDGTYGASTLYDNGGLFNGSEYDQLIVAYKNGAPVRVEELGKATNGLQQDRSTRRFINRDIDQPSVTLAVQRQPGANAVEMADAIKALLSDLQGQLPGALELYVLFDRSDSIRESVREVEFTLILAFLLVVLVIFVYLGKIRDTIIPSIAMPMSIVMTLVAMYPLGYTIDNLSLLAMTLAIGFIIDDAIVVLENIVRRIEEGETPLEASLNGSEQIGFTIVSMTLSLVAVFIPLIFMAGIIGKLFQEFAITLTIVTIASGIISLTLTPMLCSRFIPPRNELHQGRFAAFSMRLNEWALGHYKRALLWVLDHKMIALAAGAMSVILSIYFFMTMPTDFIPDEDIGFIIAYTEAEQGTSSDRMARYHQQVISILKKEPAIGSMLSISGSPEYRQGLFFIRLLPRGEREAMYSIIKDLNKKLSTIPGLNIFLKNIPLIDLNVGSQVRGSYQYLMQSLDAKELYAGAQTLMEKMRADPIFSSISTDLEVKTPQLNFEIERDQASALGITALGFERGLFLSYSGNRISRIQTPINQYDVILELDRDLQRNAQSLDYIYLRSNTTNQLVPLRAVANWSEGLGPASINHFNQFPSVTITFNLAQGIPLSIALDRLRQLAAESSTSKVIGSVKGAAETFEKSIRSMFFLIIVTIFAIYIVLGILYESFIHPLTILSTLPPAIVGALLTLYLLGKPLSLYAFLGIILLIGIVKKNGIMMVDFALENIRKKGESAEKSIFDACMVRFRPIMMTTIAAIMGAIPIALGAGAGADSRRPLGYVIIGGMLISQLITLFLTPVIYLYLEKFSERFSGKPNSISQTINEGQ